MRSEKGIKQQVLYVGNSVKMMNVSVEASLRKLRISYIDILYVRLLPLRLGYHAAYYNAGYLEK